MKVAPTFLVLSCVMLMGGCATASTEQGDAGSAGAAPMAHATLVGPSGSEQGRATLTEAADGLHVVVKAQNLTSGLHAVHIHTTGTCTAPDFASAGSHWNPTGKQHGKDNPKGMHMGDMPNMLVGSDGAGEMEYVVPGARISTGAMPLLDADGAAIVIHANADDNISDPAGNAGGRVACGAVVAG